MGSFQHFLIFEAATLMSITKNKYQDHMLFLERPNINLLIHLSL